MAKTKKSYKRTLRLKKISSGRFKVKKNPRSPFYSIPDKKPYSSYIKENVDCNDENAVLSVKETVDAVSNTVSAVRGAGKAAGNTARTIQTGVVKGTQGVRKIATEVNKIRHSKITSATVKKIATRAGKTGLTFAKNTAVKGGKALGNAAISAKDRALSGSIDKSKVTDTGTETINQGLTYLRYGGNARRAVINAEKGTVNAIKTSVDTAKEIRKIPQKVKNIPQNIQKTVKAISNASKRAVTFIKAVTSSKAIIVIGAAFAIVMLFSIMSSSITVIVNIIGGCFSWLDGGKDSNIKSKAIIEQYIDVVKKQVDDSQSEIDDIYYGFDCDRQEYEPYGEITAFREERFKYDKICIDENSEYIDVIAMAAAKWYTDILMSGDDIDDFKITDSQIKSMVLNFFECDYEYEYDYCPHHDFCCKYGYIMTGGNAADGIYADTVWYCDIFYHGCKEIKEWHVWDEANSEWVWDNIVSGSRTFCDRKHRYLKGEVKNYTTEEVMNKLSFTDDEKAMYDIYKDAITEWLAEE